MYLGKMYWNDSGGKDVRIDKLLAHSGFGTRKDVKQLLKKRAVTVDQKVVTKGNIHVDPDVEQIEVNGEQVLYQKYVYMMVHKPQNYVSATEDHRDQTVIDLVPKKYQHYDLFPVGRLDKDTEGLILLTNDGELSHRLTSPKQEVFKTYFAKIDGKVTETHIEQFKKGVVLDDGYQTKEAFLEMIVSDDISEIKLSISEGKFHQVKRMFQAIGMEVMYLKRLRIGEIELDESLSLGQTRLLNEKEMAYITSVKN